MRYWATRRSGRYMINTEKMLWKKEWVVAVAAMTPLTYSNPSLVATHLLVRDLRLCSFWNQSLSYRHEWTLLTVGWNFMCSGGGSSRGRRQRRGEDVIHPLKVSLEDLYNGTSKKLSLSRNVICSKCKGWVQTLQNSQFSAVSCLHLMTLFVTYIVSWLGW